MPGKAHLRLQEQTHGLEELLDKVYYELDIEPLLRLLTDEEYDTLMRAVDNPKRKPDATLEKIIARLQHYHEAITSHELEILREETLAALHAPAIRARLESERIVHEG